MLGVVFEAKEHGDTASAIWGWESPNRTVACRCTRVDDMYSWRAIRTESIEDVHIYLTQAFEAHHTEVVALYEDDAAGLPMHLVDLPPSAAPLLPRLVDMLNGEDAHK